VGTSHVRVRDDRVVALLLSAGVTLVAMLSGLGVIGEIPSAAAATPAHHAAVQHSGTAAVRARTGVDAVTQGPGRDALHTGVSHPRATPALPSASGDGKRVVFDISDQRVWLVDADGTVRRTYLVSGSVTDNLAPGRFQVYSRSRWAVGIQDSGVMQYFVRFTRGANAAIGFHDIPERHGVPLQTTAQLGTPQSHGCIRQDRPDAIALWDFAPTGTEVDVVA
jgi:hypothetical protein